MTTTIKVTSHNYPALVETFDNGNKVDYVILTPESGEVSFHCTTTRQLRITDLDYNDPAVLADAISKSEAPPESAQFDHEVK